jgi:hypothetical protein
MGRGTYGLVFMLDDIKAKKSLFICYARQDNEAPDLKDRWLDRFLQFIKPIVRQREINVWSDKEIKIGDNWHQKIKNQLDRANAVVLFVSPAFLESDYIANNELPVLLKRAKDKGIPIFQLLLSPCLDAETRFKYPDPRTGPEEFTFRSIQAANPPSKTLIEMTEAEQNRVMLSVARNLLSILTN